MYLSRSVRKEKWKRILMRREMLVGGIEMGYLWFVVVNVELLERSVKVVSANLYLLLMLK